MGDNVNIDEVFDKIVLAEESFTKQGFSEGIEQGRLVGYQNGYRTGAQLGAKLASEIGFYEGMAQAWIKELEQEPDKNKRKLKALRSLLEAVHNVAEYNPTDPKLNDHADVARLKFKQVCSLLNIASTDGKDTRGLSF